MVDAAGALGADCLRTARGALEFKGFADWGCALVFEGFVDAGGGLVGADCLLRVGGVFGEVD